MAPLIFLITVLPLTNEVILSSLVLTDKIKGLDFSGFQAVLHGIPSVASLVEESGLGRRGEIAKGEPRPRSRDFTLKYTCSKIF